jgi:predicted RNase H-like nuclease (RuvC/YqgF family)
MHSPPIPSQPTSPTPAADTARRITDLEALLASQTAKVHDLMTNNEHLAKQNEKNSQIIGRYRDQWEKLKAGARKKELERRERKGGEGKVGEAKDSGIVEAVEDEVGVEEPGFGKA